MNAGNNNQKQAKVVGRPFTQGQSGNLNGRPKGVPNKATGIARDALAQFIDGNIHRLNEWIYQIAEKDPEAAFKAFMSVVEFAIPKMQRLDMKTEFTETLKVSIIKFGDNPEVLEQFRQLREHQCGSYTGN